MSLTHEQIAETLHKLYPNGGWQVKGLDATFESESDKLTATEIETAYNNQQYKVKRAAEYPPIGEQLDLIYHAGQGGDAFQAAIKAVKDKYPKPE